MKVSLNWLKSYLDIQLSPEDVGDLLTSIGLEVEGMEVVESIKGGLRGVVVGHVTVCGKHPNADKLSLTKVDVGQGEELQIVCGAPNVAQGQKVLVATVGTTLYDAEGRDFKIKKGKIRGEVSQGMICAEDELGLGDDHDGIIVLPEDAPIGQPASDYYQIENDVVYDIGLTPNRSDATAHIGVAKDLAAALRINRELDVAVKMPDTSGFKVDNQEVSIDVKVENTTACPRYTGVTISGIKVSESPDWLKQRLTTIGQRPINNIVDITNFILHELGQPLHAFDTDKIGGNRILVKTLPEGTAFTTLDEVERKLTTTDLMICDGESKGMCIGGVFGGIGSGVTDNTTSIFLEAAHFNAKWIRRTSMHHLLRTDAATCFEKGSDPNITRYALERAALLIQELAGGTISSEVVDIYPEPVAKVEIDVKYKRVSRLIGVDIPVTEIKAILAALEMDILTEDADGLRVAVPTNKADVLREADVIEEILRIYGFNKVPISDQLRSTIVISEKPNPHQLRNHAADMLATQGFHEIMAVSLTESRYFQDILPMPEAELVYVNNTSNSHLDVMRPTMLFSGLEAVVHNQNRQHADLRLFEFGKSYRRTEDDFKETNHLSLFLTGRREAESWQNNGTQGTSFYQLKAYVELVLRKLGISGYQESDLQDEVFTYAMNYHRGPRSLVRFGKVQASIQRALSIKQEVFYAIFDWDAIFKALKKHKVEVKDLTKYPSVRRDLALIIDNSTKFGDIANIARKTGKSLLKAVNLFDIYENEDQLGAGKKSYAVSFVFEDPTKTLKDKEVDKIMNKLIQSYEQQLSATIRR